jgi:hypothetical protein
MSFQCETCKFICGKQSDWARHIKTRKHLNNADVESAKTPQTYLCGICDKEYSNRSSLWYHTKKCGNVCKPEQPSNIIEPEKTPYLDIINKLLTDNMELRNFIIEQSKITADTMNKVIEQNSDMMNKVIESNKTTVINQTNTQNNNNQKFNINMFLNEECKDAINFSDFIKSIEVSREDLENNAQLGFVNGVSKILIDSLKQLSKTERPIHCTDVKRETMYIKDEDKWAKEEDSSKLNKAIQEVTRKSMGTLMNWKEENPDYKDRDSEFSGRCIVIQQQSMAAHNRDTYYPKVVKAIAKEVVVDK